MKKPKSPKGKRKAPLPGRNSRGQWLPGVSGCPPEKRVFVPGHRLGFQPGQSGNPSGVSKARRLFEEEFYHALLNRGTPERAAQLLWEAAEAKEPWAVQMLLDRLAPKDSKLRVEVSKADEESRFDPRKLSPEQLDELIRLMEIAGNEPTAIEGGTGTAQPTDVH